MALTEKDQLNLYNAYLTFRTSEKQSPAYNKAVKTIKQINEKIANGN